VDTLARHCDSLKMTTFLINGATEQSNALENDDEFSNVVKRQPSQQCIDHSERTGATSRSASESSSSSSSLLSEDDAAVKTSEPTSNTATIVTLQDADDDSATLMKEMHKRNKSLGHVCPHEADLVRAKSAGDALPNFKSFTATGRPPLLKRNLSLPALTNQQKAKVFAHRSILLVKTQADALKKLPDDDPNVLYQAMQRRRRKALLTDGVVFDRIEIREYPVTLGDNPGGNWGPPLQLSWDYQDSVTVTVEEFETQHPPRRSGTQINIPKRVREDMLIKAGFSRMEIQEGVKQANLTRNRRKRTTESMQLAAFHELAEKVKRTTSNAFFRRGKKNKERQFLKFAMELHRKLKLEDRSDEFRVEVDEQVENEDVREQENSSDDTDDLLMC
jgi:hypothetical protein